MKAKKIIVCFALTIALTVFAGNVYAVIDFEDLTLGDDYHVGDNFVSSCASITGQEFCGDSGGFTRVEDGGLAGGAGNELQINNINLNFDFGMAQSGLALQYGEYGGNLNININGDFVNFEDFAEINGSSIGGVSVFALDAGSPGNCKGSLFLVGNINTFVLGGQELWIDNIVGCCIPEPATAALLCMGGLALARIRRSR